MAKRQHSGTRVFVDDRWSGLHGIGRYATEVLKRLPQHADPIATSGRPMSARDIISLKRLFLSPADVIYSPGFNVSLTRARQLVTVHDLIHLHESSKISIARSLYFNLLVRWTVKRCGVVVTDSLASAEAIRHWLGTAKVDIVVAGAGRSAAFTGEGDRRVFTRPTFVFVSSIRPHKNLTTLLDAFVLRPEYDLIIVTSDTDEAAALIGARSLADRVSVESGLSDDDLAALYRGSAGSVVPSLIEGFGLPPLEAMSCGVRVAHWQGCGSVAEICGSTAVIVTTATSAPEWATALDSLIAMGPLRADELNTGWWQEHTWDNTAAQVAAAISSLTTDVAIPKVTSTGKVEE